MYECFNSLHFFHVCNYMQMIGKDHQFLKLYTSLVIYNCEGNRPICIHTLLSCMLTTIGQETWYLIVVLQKVNAPTL